MYRVYTLAISLVLMLHTIARAQADEPGEKIQPHAISKLLKVRCGRASNETDQKRAEVELRRAARTVGGIAKLLGKYGLNDDDEEIRIYAAQRLANLGPTAEVAVPALIAALGDRCVYVRIEAANALGHTFFERRIPRKFERVVPTLIEVMRKDKDYSVRERACVALRMIGSDAKAAVPALIDVVKDKKQGQFREIAVWALYWIGAPAKSAVPTFLEILTRPNENPKLQADILASLGKIGAEEKVAFPILIAALQDPKRPDFRQAAAAGLHAYGARAKVAVPALLKSLDVSDVPDLKTANLIREYILITLEEIGIEAMAAVRVVEKIAHNPKEDMDVRRAASQALKSIRR